MKHKELARDVHERIAQLEAECERLRAQLTEVKHSERLLWHAAKQAEGERQRREEAEKLVAELADALDDMWWQFAYRGAKGQLLTGGLSALEHCEAVRENHPELSEHWITPQSSGG